jgi:predicted membrane protein
MRADMRDDRGPGETPRRLRITPQVVLGLLVVGFGLVLLLDNLGVADADRVLRYWPLGLVLIGGMKLTQRGQSGRVFGALLLFIGLGLTAEHVLYLPVDADDWWPVVLIGFGVLILARAFGTRTAAPAGAATTGEQHLSEFATWSGKQRRVASSKFRSADLTAIMGGIELDLRAAGTATGEAVIDVFVMWGGVEIWVPPDWAVSNEVNLLMGGAEDRSTGAQGATHRLIVRGFVVMGGLEIKT